MLVVALQVVLAEETEKDVKGMEQRLAVLEEETAALRRRRATLTLTLEVSEPSLRRAPFIGGAGGWLSRRVKLTVEGF